AYVALAIEQRDLAAVGWAVAAMLLVILAYDQLLFRPLVAWAGKFRFEQSAAKTQSRSVVLDVVRRTRLLAVTLRPSGRALHALSALPLGLRARLPRAPAAPWGDRAWGVIVLMGAAYAVWRIGAFVATEIAIAEIGHVVQLGAITAVRVVVLIALATVV